MIQDDQNKVQITTKEVGNLAIDTGRAVLVDWGLFNLLLTRARVEAEKGDEALEKFLSNAEKRFVEIPMGNDGRYEVTVTQRVTEFEIPGETGKAKNAQTISLTFEKI